MKQWLRARLPGIAVWPVLALATLIVCWPLGLTNRILAGVDAFTYFTPYWAHRMEAFRGGTIPLWNPYLFSGTPFLANIQAAVLYPLHWPLSWLRAEQALVWSALLHIWLAGGFTYLLATRSLRVGRIAGILAGLIFGLGGFTLARIENINQLNALAWLPALLWLYDETVQRPRKLLSFVALTVVIALQLLAGHTQTTFINMVGLGVWALMSLGWPLRRAKLLYLLPLLAVIPALALSAAQLLPTIELNGLGLRTGGLDFRTAVSFSLRPQLLLQSLLPPFSRGLDEAFGSEGYAEFVGYTGVIGLVLAGAGAATAWRRRWSGDPGASTGAGSALRSLALALLGAFLALGAYNPVYYLLWRFVPGFDLFRAPARWLELYALGSALLAGYGLQALRETTLGRLRFPRRAWARAVLGMGVIGVLALLAWQRWPARQTIAVWLGLAAAVLLVLALRALPHLRVSMLERTLVVLLVAELLLASRALPFAQATAPMATALRNAPASLLAATAGQPPAGRDRFLSLSNIRYDPGDLAELLALQSDLIPPGAAERLVRAAKQVEVLAPNLSLFFHLPAVDGYDGGLLPLQRYVKLQELFLPPDQMTPDGRLAEQLPAIPDARLLDLTGVRYVITDKQRDLWAGDVYYDLEQAATVPAGGALDLDLAGYPAFPATAIGVIATSSPITRPATITVTMADGSEVPFDLYTTDLFDGKAPPPKVFHLPANTLARITFRNPTPEPVSVLGLSLIDEETSAHQSVTLSPGGDFRRIHSGDVKIYERIGAPGRAWLVHGVKPVRDAAEAQAALADPAFAPRSIAVVEAPFPPAPSAEAQISESVTTVGYAEERQTYEVEATSPGLLVVADAWYPGWRATVDGRPAQILRTNLLYRGVALEAGRHEVTFEYTPQSWHTGLVVTSATLLLLLGLVVAAVLMRKPGLTTGA